MTARINPKHFVQLDIPYVIDNIDSPLTGVKRGVFLANQVVADMVTCATSLKGLYDGLIFSDYDILFLNISLCKNYMRLKIL